LIDHAVRSKGIGASEIAAVFDMHPNMSAWDLWAKKTGLLDDVISETEGRAAWGKRLERAIAEGYSEITGRPVEWIDRTMFGKASPIQVYTPDAVCVMEPIGVDCKNRGIDQYPKFGEPGTDQVPDEISMQCHWSISAAGFDAWHVPVLFGGNDLRIYICPKDEEMEGMLVEAGERFWRDFVVAGVEPQIKDTERAQEYMRRRFPKHNGILREPTTAERDLIDRYRPVRAEFNRLKKTKADMEMQIKLAIGEATGLEWPVGAHDFEQITHKKCKDGIVVEWESVARGLATKVTPDDWQTIVGLQTIDKVGSRRLRVKFEKETDNDE
jgi:predicted phage-related endonuclease